jgi:hypothetical protein
VDTRHTTERPSFALLNGQIHPIRMPTDCETRVLTWAPIGRAGPDLAEAGRRLLYPFGSGWPSWPPSAPTAVPDCTQCALGDRRRAAGLPPALTQARLPAPRRPLCPHAFPPEDNEDAFYVSGRAVLVDDPERRELATAQFLAERRLPAAPQEFDAQDLFGFYLKRACERRPGATATGTPARAASEGLSTSRPR